jgi:outer membrane protein assembly factor BamA
MRWKLAHICIVATAWLWASQQFLYAQHAASNLISETQTDAVCQSSGAGEDEEPTGPEISITEVTFSGSVEMPPSDQQQIADSIKKTHGTSLHLVTDEGLELARAGWQDLGYFRAAVSGESKVLTSSAVSQSIALHVRVNEGERYALKEITFKNNKAIQDVELLRGLFPIKDGDIFSRTKIGVGLENLRKAYGELGYINFTSVPDTEFDDGNKLVALQVDFDEGKQFRIGSIRILGLEDSAREKLLESLSIKPGQILTSKLWEALLLQIPMCDCPSHEQVRDDSQSGIRTLTLDFRPCPKS